eukprot:COSAG01_NODE_1936_length_8861_cov_27.526364_1_plen_214_part_00
MAARAGTTASGTTTAAATRATTATTAAASSTASSTAAAVSCEVAAVSSVVSSAVSSAAAAALAAASRGLGNPGEVAPGWRKSNPASNPPLVGCKVYVAEYKRGDGVLTEEVLTLSPGTTQKVGIVESRDQFLDLVRQGVIVGSTLVFWHQAPQGTWHEASDLAVRQMCDYTRQGQAGWAALFGKQQTSGSGQAAAAAAAVLLIDYSQDCMPPR